jgi:hypothetical protein
MDALATHCITREAKVATRARYGWKVEEGELVPHIRQQLVIEKVMKLRSSRTAREPTLQFVLLRMQLCQSIHLTFGPWAGSGEILVSL